MFLAVGCGMAEMKCYNFCCEHLMVQGTYPELTTRAPGKVASVELVPEFTYLVSMSGRRL